MAILDATNRSYSAGQACAPYCYEEYELQFGAVTLLSMKAPRKRLKRKRDPGMSFGELVQRLWQPESDEPKPKAVALNSRSGHPCGICVEKRNVLKKAATKWRIDGGSYLVRLFALMLACVGNGYRCAAKGNSAGNGRMRAEGLAPPS
jgi:hypothetical protein